MERWVGKVAVVTGSSSGIGNGVAREFAKQGIHVVAIARRVERLHELAESLSKEKGKIYPFKTDLTNEAEITAAFDWVEKKFGGVDILVNSAGIIKKSSLRDGDTNDWRSIFDTNVLGLCIATRQAVRSMRARNVAGYIIHINSVAGHKVPVYHGHISNVYPASKHAVTALAESLRLELLHEKSKIKVSSISPALTDTEILHDVENKMCDVAAMVGSNIKMLEPLDVAKAAVYLLTTPPHVLVTELTLRPIEQI